MECQDALKAANSGGGGGLTRDRVEAHDNVVTALIQAASERRGTRILDGLTLIVCSFLTVTLSAGIPPGAADVAHYRIKIPKDAKGPITLTAKLNHRKFLWYFTQFAYAGKPKPGTP